MINYDFHVGDLIWLTENGEKTHVAVTHCGFNMIELCKKQRKNTKKNVSKSNNRRPDTKGTDAV